STENKYIGGKRYKVRIANVIELDQSLTFGEGELEFETTELPFAESIGTSSDIDSPELIPLIPELWQQGFWNNTLSPLKSTSDTEIRYDKELFLSPNTEYTLVSNGDYEARLRMYDET